MAAEPMIAVITGGTAGVGRAAVREFARAGYDVAVLARGRTGLDGAVADVRRAGRRGLAVPTDVCDCGAVSAAADRIERELGEIGVWVNAAFAGSLAFFWDMSMDEYRRITEVTYYGQVYGTRAALRHMRPRNRGVIVNVGSAMAERSIPLQSAYCGAKHAIKGFTESVTTELANSHSDVKLCMVQLPGLNTPQFRWNLDKLPERPMPVPPVFAPELAGLAIRFLAEHPRRTMWVGFSTAYTILGERVAPKFLDWYLGRSGVRAQQTRRDTGRLSPNLDAPSDDTTDVGATGPFVRQTHSVDVLTWASMHRRALMVGAGAAVAAAAATLGGRRLRSTT